MEKDKNKEPYNPLPEYLSIGPSDIHGAGILATEDIPGEVVIGISHAVSYTHLTLPTNREV